MEIVGTETKALKEAKIQQQLDLRRSGSSSRLRLSHGSSSSRRLTVDEEDELEGMAGDTGSARRFDDPDVIEARLSSECQLVYANSSAHEAEKDGNGGQVPSNSRNSTGHVQALEKLNGEFELLSTFSHLAIFGIIGVLIRYGLEQLFGPPVAKVTNDRTALFNDLPANMLGSFFMGWVGVVYKKDIATFSEHLAVGLSTGLMGSITTYASMMQRMLTNMVEGRWTIGLCGLLLGMELAQVSLVVGIDSAKLLRIYVERINVDRIRNGKKPLQAPAPENYRRRCWSLLLSTLVSTCLWTGSLLGAVFDRNSLSRRTLWLACVFAPAGVWLRWYCARLNGQGLGSQHYLRWLPFGTFLVNVGASTIEAGFATEDASVVKYNARWVSGALQLGFLGCLSTVSTFVAEIQIMHQGKNPWRAYVYVLFTILTSLVLGFLIYGVPVWVLNLKVKPLRNY